MPCRAFFKDFRVGGGGALAKRDLPSAEQSGIADCGRKATRA